MLPRTVYRLVARWVSVRLHITQPKKEQASPKNRAAYSLQNFTECTVRPSSDSRAFKGPPQDYNTSVFYLANIYCTVKDILEDRDAKQLMLQQPFWRERPKSKVRTRYSASSVRLTNQPIEARPDALCPSVVCVTPNFKRGGREDANHSIPKNLEWMRRGTGASAIILFCSSGYARVVSSVPSYTVQYYSWLSNASTMYCCSFTALEKQICSPAE